MTYVDYHTISADLSHLVMRDAHGSPAFFTTSGDARPNGFFDQIDIRLA